MVEYSTSSGAATILEEENQGDSNKHCHLLGQIITQCSWQAEQREEHSLQASSANRQLGAKLISSRTESSLRTRDPSNKVLASDRCHVAYEDYALNREDLSQPQQQRLPHEQQQRHRCQPSRLPFVRESKQRPRQSEWEGSRDSATRIETNHRGPKGTGEINVIFGRKKCSSASDNSETKDEIICSNEGVLTTHNISTSVANLISNATTATNSGSFNTITTNITDLTIATDRIIVETEDCATQLDACNDHHNELGDILDSERKKDSLNKLHQQEIPGGNNRPDKSITIQTLESVLAKINDHDVPSEIDWDLLLNESNDYHSFRTTSESQLQSLLSTSGTIYESNEASENDYHSNNLRPIKPSASSHLSTTVLASKNIKLSQQLQNEVSYDVEFSANSDCNLSAPSSLKQEQQFHEALHRSQQQVLAQQLDIIQADNSTEPRDCQELQTSTSQPAGHQQQNQHLGFQLRALSAKSEALDVSPFQGSTQLADNLNVPSLSTELVNETLNYFVNCRQRLSQMTKTYDDSDAYLLLLQEKEVDLELAARIGQDLLKQNKQLKDSIKNLEDELAKRRDDVQQLRHELASKISLLDTFIEEEEAEQHNHNLDHSNRATTFKDESEDQFPSSTSTNQLKSFGSKSNISLLQHRDRDESAATSGFLSLTPHQKSYAPEHPFASLPYHVNSADYQPDPSAGHDFLTNEDGTQDTQQTSGIKSTSNTDATTQKLVEDVTFQLVESNKRLCELQDELIFKSEQSLLQQEKIFRLEQQIRESDRRLDDIASENETLRKSILDSAETQRELSDELKVCRKNFSELLGVFLELQKESRINRNLQEHNSLLATYYGELDQINDINNISFDSFVAPADSPPPPFSHPVHQQSKRSDLSTTTATTLGCSPNSTSLLDRSLLNDNNNQPTATRNAHSTTAPNINLQSASPKTTKPRDINCNFCSPTTTENLTISKSLVDQQTTSTPPASSGLLESEGLKCNWMVTSSSLHEELRESMHRMGESSEHEEDEPDGRHVGAEEGDDEEEALSLSATTPATGSRSHPGRSPKHRRGLPPTQAQLVRAQDKTRNCSSDQHSDSDGADSGLHNTNLSHSATSHGPNTDTDSDDFLCSASRSPESVATDSGPSSGGKDRLAKRSWLGLSSFMITTLLLLCLSASFNSSANSNLAQKLQQIKLER